ncbi:MAG TPA: hypothetical protein DCL48_10785, partial [Alphaproteobacteria bacterium]|nr:hypothetical protein [Alphaproteobacteria bacterium]
ASYTDPTGQAVRATITVFVNKPATQAGQPLVTIVTNTASLAVDPNETVRVAYQIVSTPPKADSKFSRVWSLRHVASGKIATKTLNNLADPKDPTLRAVMFRITDFFPEAVSYSGTATVSYELSVEVTDTETGATAKSAAVPIKLRGLIQ